MARLPVVGEDDGAWGTVLNEFLEVGHNPDGTLISGGGDSMFIDARDYGTHFNYLDDDTAAIQAALDAAVSPPIAEDPGATGNYLPSTIVQLPSGRGVLTAPLEVPANTILRGHGRGATMLYNDVSFTSGAMITNGPSGASTQVSIQDLGIVIYNTTVDGVDLTTAAGGSLTADTQHSIERVTVYGGARSFIISGTECRLRDCVSHLANGTSFDIQGSDHFIHGCTSGGSVATGGFDFVFTSANNKMSDCKAYGSAQGSLNASGGGRHIISNFEAQDNKGGISFGGPTVATNILSDSCCDGMAGSSAISFSGAYVKVQGTIVGNRGGAAYTTPCAFNVPSAAYTPLTLDVQVYGLGTRVWQSGPYSGVDARLNGMGSVYVAAFATPYVPDPLLATVHQIPVTNTLSISDPVSVEPLAAFPGMELGFVFAQDATGRTISFGSAYKVSAAIATTASSTTSIMFRYDGTYWRETTRAVT